MIPHTLALLAMLSAFLALPAAGATTAHSWKVLPASSWAGDPAVSVSVRLTENGVDIGQSQVLQGPLLPGAPREVSAESFFGTTRTICVGAIASRAAVAPTDPNAPTVVQASSPEVTACTSFRPALDVPVLQQPQP